MTVNRVCGSGAQAIATAATEIWAGLVDCAIAGGMENMDRAPYLFPQGRWGARMGDTALIDSMLNDGLNDAFSGFNAFSSLGDQGHARADLGRIKAQQSFLASLTRKLKADGTLSDRRVWADLGGRVPDGICLDAEGAIWLADAAAASQSELIPASALRCRAFSASTMDGAGPNMRAARRFSTMRGRRPESPCFVAMLATASIGQVHTARLLDEIGRAHV